MKVIVFLIGILTSYGLQAQYFRLGENPASIKWRQIKTENFQVIFPDSKEEQAQYAANILETAYLYAGQSLNRKPAKISVIIQVNTAGYNGFVTWAPKRMEIYDLPPQDNDQSDYLSNLIIHEFRHVVQIDNLNRGLTKVLYGLFGEQGVGFILGLTTPRWFLEGDAVGAETAFSDGGRGRVADFEMKLRSQWLEGQVFSYEKASFGSFKSIVPGNYELGYFLTTYGKIKFGIDLWGRVQARIGKMPLTPFRFSNALKKETGVTTKEFYSLAVDYYSRKWKGELDSVSVLNDSLLVVSSPKVPTNYTNPLPTKFGDVAIKQGYNDVYQVCLFKDGSFEKVCEMGLYKGGRVCANSETVVWAEEQADLRWGYRSFSNIVLLNVGTGRKRYFTRKKRLYSPTINDKGSKVMAVAISEEGEQSIVQFEVARKRQLELVNALEDENLQYPVYGDGNVVYYVSFKRKEGYRLVELDVQSKLKRILKVQHQELSHLNYHNGALYYRSALNGIDNAYRYVLSQDKEEQLTSSKTGVFSPVISNDSLFYSVYTTNGYNLVKEEIKVLGADRYELRVADSLQLLEGGFDLVDSIKVDTFSSRKYAKIGHLFNLHSWQPVVLDVDNLSSPSIGVQLLSQNKLSSTVTILSAGYDPSDNKRNLSAKIDYRGWYPTLGFELYSDKYFDRNYRFVNESDTVVFNADRTVSGLETSIGVPLKKNHFNYVYYFTPTVALNYEKQNFSGGIINTVDRLPLTYSVSFSRSRLLSKRDVTSKWSQAFGFGYRHAPILKDRGETVYGYVNVTVPFGFKHQVLRCYLGGQQELEQGAVYSTFIRWPRGFASRRVNEIQSLKLDWVTPIAYPDLNLSFLSYIQRVKGGLFFDYAQVRFRDRVEEISSTGFELSADMNVFRYSYLLNIGLRYIYGLSSDFNSTELILSFGF